MATQPGGGTPLGERIAALESKLRMLCDDVDRQDRTIESLKARIAVVSEQLHERITRIEVRVAYYAGIAAALGGAVGTVVGAVLMQVL